ncbi:TRIC cation channel family protein [Homoserinimonas sp. OAct 916]|uniref:TRIC cation channel family protein n=1 Tax=Homoserinimonas sp. OAct 916 TaxID=2211450 RepID=UPI0034CD4816
MLRDVVANRDPQLFNPNDIYAVPAMLGAALLTVLWSIGFYNALAQLLVAVLVFGLRMLSLHYNWHVPHAAATGSGDAQKNG